MAQVKDHKVSNILIVPQLWNWTPVTERKSETVSHVPFESCPDQLISLGTVSYLKGFFFWLKNKGTKEWNGEHFISQKEANKNKVVDSQEVFWMLTHKFLHKAPLSVNCPRLRMEHSCMMMNSIWITLGLKTHVRSRLPLSILFTSSLSSSMTYLRSAGLYVMFEW